MLLVLVYFQNFLRKKQFCSFTFQKYLIYDFYS